MPTSSCYRRYKVFPFWYCWDPKCVAKNDTSSHRNCNDILRRRANATLSTTTPTRPPTKRTQNTTRICAIITTHLVIWLDDLVNGLHHVLSRPHLPVFHVHRAAFLCGAGRDGDSLDVHAEYPKGVNGRLPVSFLVPEHDEAFSVKYAKRDIKATMGKGGLSIKGASYRVSFNSVPHEHLLLWCQSTVKANYGKFAFCLGVDVLCLMKRFTFERESRGNGKESERETDAQRTRIHNTPVWKIMNGLVHTSDREITEDSHLMIYTFQGRSVTASPRYRVGSRTTCEDLAGVSRVGPVPLHVQILYSIS